jgi:glutamate 5-kinase
MASRRIVVKVGSSTLAPDGGPLDIAFARDLVRQLCEIRDTGVHPVLVTSGAIAAGVQRFGMPRRPADMPSLQAAASVGQVALIECYAALFAERGVTIGQVLLTRHDTGHREAFLHARDTLERLIDLGAIPVVNENDTVAVDEIRFGDNDSLSALVATMVDADVVVILSDIEGLYDSDPRVSDSARLLEQVDDVTTELIAAAGGAGSAAGSGGMATKLDAARVLMRAGIPLVVCDGRRQDVVIDAVEGRPCGTVFAPGEGSLGARKSWIALGRRPAGEIVIDEGAKRAILEREASLLPAGVVSVAGSFVPGDTVVLKDASGGVLARGLVAVSSPDLGRIMGMKTGDVAREFPHLAGKEVVHRDSLAPL